MPANTLIKVGGSPTATPMLRRGQRRSTFSRTFCCWLLLAVLQAVGSPPALAFHLFGLFAMGLAAVAALRLYTELVGTDTTSKR